MIHLATYCFLIAVGLTKDEVAAQGLLFFSAGYDTVATSIIYLIYNLALHPDFQEKVYEEIMGVIGEQVGTGKYSC